MKNISTQFSKTILVVEGDEDIEDNLRFANLTSIYIINSVTYIIVFSIGFIINLILRFVKPKYTTVIFN